MKYITLGAATLACLALPVTAHAQLFGGFDNNTILGGAVGAGLGGAIGSNLAGAGVRDEGTAIGAALGGLAGAAYGNSRSRYAGNPYAGSFNPGFNSGNLLGTGIGAGLGGVIGSNLAGSGQRQEGTAIGAVLGGLAGYSLANARSNQSFGQDFGQGFGPSYIQGYGFNQGPSFNQGYVPHMPQSSTRFGGVIDNGVQYVPSGQFVTTGYTQQHYVAPPTMRAPVMQRPVVQPHVYVAPQTHHHTYNYQTYNNQPQRMNLPVAPSIQALSQGQPVQSYHTQGHYGHAAQKAAPKTFCYKGSNRRYRADGAEFVGGCGH